MRDVKVSEVMATGVHHVSPRLGVLDLEQELAAQRISGAPVLDRAGKVVGIVSRSDLDKALTRERSRAAAIASYYVETDPEAFDPKTPDPTGAALERVRELAVQDIMTREVISVSPDDAITHAAEVMRSRRIHRVLVIEDGALVGLLSSLDIVGAVADQA
jgi:CBS domain-containing protein